MSAPSLPIRGGCLCGAVRYEVDAPFVSASYCHCTRCQRRTGTAAAASARVAPGTLRIVSGEELITAWPPPDGFPKCFCSRCGGALWSRDPANPEVLGVRLGTVDGDPGVRPQWRTYVACAAPWEPIPEDGLPRYDESRPVLRTARLVLFPLTRLDEAEHARASGNAADAARDAGAADAQWREHGFGPWAIRDGRDDGFLGGAELRFAGEGIDGIAPGEVEAGWWVTEGRRNEGIASEAMQAALADLWRRTGADAVTAYLEEQNEPSRRLAVKLGFAVRGRGRGRSGEPMTVYELHRPH